MGANEPTIIITAIAEAPCLMSNLSLMMARAITTPAHPPSACKKRKHTNREMESAAAQAKLVSV